MTTNRYAGMFYEVFTVSITHVIVGMSLDAVLRGCDPFQQPTNVYGGEHSLAAYLGAIGDLKR